MLVRQRTIAAAKAEEQAAKAITISPKKKSEKRGRQARKEEPPCDLFNYN